MDQAEHFDALVLGSGPGRKFTRVAPGAIRATGGRRRTAVCRRFLPQHRLHAQQERNLERAHSLSCPACGAVRHNHRPGHDRHGEGRQQVRQVFRGIADHLVMELRKYTELAEDARCPAERRRLTGDKVFIDVGSHAAMPSIPAPLERDGQYWRQV